MKTLQLEVVLNNDDILFGRSYPWTQAKQDQIIKASKDCVVGQGYLSFPTITDDWTCIPFNQIRYITVLGADTSAY